MTLCRAACHALTALLCALRARQTTKELYMNRIIYIIGLIVVIVAILGFLGLG